MSITNPDHICINCMREKPSAKVCPFCGFDEAQYEPSPHHLPPRSILGGKCLIGRVLGEGGFGITYLGWDLNLDLKLAIKEYYPTGFVTRTNTSTNTVTPYRGEKTEFFTTGRSRFINEAKTLAKYYTLPGIVSVREFFLENGTAYIVMEFVEGETLKQRLARVGGKMDASAVFDLVRPLLRSLSQMHASGLIHRDISPDNIMITPENNIKLIDFGAARDYLDSGNRSLSVMLKPGFAPEEQYFARGQQGPWTDIYALCATVYRAITGVTPQESVERLRHDELQPPSVLGARLTPAQEAALLKGLSVAQEDRWQSVPELYASLYADPIETGTQLQDITQGIVPAQPAARTGVLAKIAGQSLEAIKKIARSIQLAAPKAIVATDGTTAEASQVGITGNSIKDTLLKWKEKAKLKGRRSAIVLASSLLGLILVVFFSSAFLNRSAAIQQMEDLDFASAAEAFDRILFGSALFPEDAKYLAVARMTIEDNYTGAEIMLRSLGDYRASKTLLNEVKYQEGLYRVEIGDYKRASSVLQSIGFYRDAKAQERNSRLQLALSLSNKGEFSEALTILNELNDAAYAPAKEQLVKVSLKLADHQANGGNYGLAYQTLDKISALGEVATQMSIYRQEAYRSGVSLYRKGYYLSAKDQFDYIGAYDDSKDYVDLIAVHLKGYVSGVSTSELIALIGFEDAAELLVQEHIQAKSFLLGHWTGSGYYFTMKEDGHINYNLPYFNYGYYYRIEDGEVLLYPKDDENDTKMLFRFTVLSKDSVSVYCAKNKTSYTLTRK